MSGIPFVGGTPEGFVTHYPGAPDDMTPDGYIDEALAIVVGGGTTAGGGGIPGSPTALLDANDLEAGSFGGVANSGSAGGSWAQNHTGVTVETTLGPNLRKWLKNPKTSFQDYVLVSGKTLADFFGASAGMIGFIFKCENAKSWFASPDLVLFSYVSSPNHGVYLDSSPASKSYVPKTWRAGVFRWDGTKGYQKLDGDSVWAENADGALSALTAALYVLGDGSAAADAGCSLFATYNAQSADDGDALLAYLADLIDPTPEGHSQLGTFQFASDYTAGATSGDLTNQTVQVAVNDYGYNPQTGEIIKFTFVSGNLVSYSRAQLGTTAAAISSTAVWKSYRAS